ncbi:type IA DNA topoisomerase [Helicobacter bizzozeronii]|uniref:type IA DNA topoisomerase n=1 Tax=Helicobacter bizzozeronii TaxID=56877 RepID=UPI000CEE7755|nr:type IA DNA topoisomerase [Helicobacter bizzozeronii]
MQKPDVIIIESPNKIKKIASITGAKVLATIGHFMELEGIEGENFTPKFAYKADKKQQIYAMIEQCRGKRVYIATDPDREGYAIGKMFYEKIKNVAKEVFRVEFHEITESGINKGLQSALLFANTNFSYYESFLARSVGDYYIGYTLSPYLGDCLQQRKGNSAGRVQTPCLKLIVDRDKEIEAFKALPESQRVSYQMQAKIYDAHNKEVILRHCNSEGKEIKFESQEQALVVLEPLKECKVALVLDIKHSTTSSPPPKPFITSSLLKVGSSQLGLSTQQVQECAQKLFEAGLITYMRTDAETLSQEFLDKAEKFYQVLYTDLYERRSYKAKNSQAEAHEAIRITHCHKFEETQNVLVKAGITSSQEQALYTLIFQRILESQGKNAVYAKQDLLFKIKDGFFKCCVRSLQEAGYLDMFKHTEQAKGAEQAENAQNAYLDLKTDSTIHLLSLDIAPIHKHAQSAYVEASFIEVLEKNGIGRPSTYASYLPKLLSREYIQITLDQRRVVNATHKGQKVISIFEKSPYSWIVDTQFTALMEELLDKIAREECSYVEYMQMIAKKCPQMPSLAQREEYPLRSPKESQIKYVQDILRDLKMELPCEFADYAKDDRITKAFLDKFIPKHNEIREKAKQEGGYLGDNTPASKPATAKQVAFAESLSQKHNVKLPKDYKSNMQVCSGFIEEWKGK